MVASIWLEIAHAGASFWIYKMCPKVSFFEKDGSFFPFRQKWLLALEREPCSDLIYVSFRSRFCCGSCTDENCVFLRPEQPASLNLRVQSIWKKLLPLPSPSLPSPHAFLPSSVLSDQYSLSTYCLPVSGVISEDARYSFYLQRIYHLVEENQTNKQRIEFSVTV